MSELRHSFNNCVTLCSLNSTSIRLNVSDGDDEDEQEEEGGHEGKEDRGDDDDDDDTINMIIISDTVPCLKFFFFNITYQKQSIVHHQVHGRKCS